MKNVSKNMKWTMNINWPQELMKIKQHHQNQHEINVLQFDTKCKFFKSFFCFLFSFFRKKSKYWNICISYWKYRMTQYVKTGNRRKSINFHFYLSHTHTFHIFQKGNSIHILCNIKSKMNNRCCDAVFNIYRLLRIYVTEYNQNPMRPNKNDV